MYGPRLVVLGAVFNSVLLALFLYRVTASAAYAPQRLKPQSVPSEQELVENSWEEDNAAGVCMLSERFPVSVLQWCDLITRHAGENNLEPDLVAGLIWLESGGNPEAYSRSGAVGLMQVMPRDGLAATFNCKNGSCFSDRPTIEELKDPGFNIAYGTGMLADLLLRHGDLREALQAYGPMDVGYTYADKVLGIYKRYGN